MPRLTLLVILLGMLCEVPSSPQSRFASRVVGKGAAKVFLCRRYGFSVPVPPNWFVGLLGDTPFYSNFPPQDTLGGGALPRNGATISIVAQESLPGKEGRETLGSWADRDADLGAAESVIKQDFGIPPETGIERAVRVSFDRKRFGPDDQAQHDVNIYWVFRGKVFATYLEYVHGDPRAQEYESLVGSLMKRVRPLG